MPLTSEPFPRPHPGYDRIWANRLIQRLNQFIFEYVQSDRIINGALITKERRIVAVTIVTNSYQILRTDHFVEVDASSAVNVTLPANPSAGQVFEVQDSSGNASGNNISILPPSGITLNGAMSAFVISTDYGRARAYYNGTQYLCAS